MFFNLQTCIFLAGQCKQFLVFSVPEHENPCCKAHMRYAFPPVLHMIFKRA